MVTMATKLSHRTLEKLAGAPVLVLANKSELGSSLLTAQVSQRLNLKDLITARQWHIQASAGKNG